MIANAPRSKTSLPPSSPQPGSSGLPMGTEPVVSRETTAAPVSSLQPHTQPDAPLTRVGRVVTASLHAAVLVGIVAFVVYQLSLAASAPKRAAIVKVVASRLRSVPAPGDGVFRAAKHFPPGAQVQSGELLGHLLSCDPARDGAALRQELGQLRAQRLALRSIEHADPAELVRMTQQMEAVKRRLGELLRSATLPVTSPTTGRMELGISGDRAVEQDVPLVELWSAEDPLFLEVSGPLPVVHRLLKREHVTATFETEYGTVTVDAKPLAASLKSLQRDDGEEQALWAVVQCVPQGLPSRLAVPGMLGHL